jgi:hypothetical protein
LCVGRFTVWRTLRALAPATHRWIFNRRIYSFWCQMCKYPSYYVCVYLFNSRSGALLFFLSISRAARQVFKLRFQLDSSKNLKFVFKRKKKYKLSPEDRTRLIFYFLSKTTKIDQRDSCLNIQCTLDHFFFVLFLSEVEIIITWCSIFSSKLLNDSLLFHVPLHIKFTFNNFGNKRKNDFLWYKFFLF